MFRAPLQPVNAARIFCTKPVPTPAPPGSSLLLKRCLSQWPFPSRPQSNYQGFGSTGPASSWLYRWAAHPHFYYHIVGITTLGVGNYAYDLEEVSISHRIRFNIIGQAWEEAIASCARDETLSTYHERILPDYDPRHKMVEHVLNRLVPYSGLPGLDWQVHVVDDPQRNAFVVPGGKVFVFTGILPVCEGEVGVATVLSHEISHIIARHSAERMSQGFLVFGVVAVACQWLGIDPRLSRLLLELGYSRPNSRTQEAEADYIGLLMMSKACYDPRAAISFWTRMQRTEQIEPPQFLSTHPGHADRFGRIQAALSEALDVFETSDCSMTANWATSFRTGVIPR